MRYKEIASIDIRSVPTLRAGDMRSLITRAPCIKIGSVANIHRRAYGLAEAQPRLSCRLILGARSSRESFSGWTPRVETSRRKDGEHG
jgi:hypothetical protein